MPQAEHWYRLIMDDGDIIRHHIGEHILGMVNVVSHSFICCTGIRALTPGQTEYPQLIATIILNGTKNADDATVLTLVNHLVNDHGYVVLSVSEIDTQAIYP